MKKLCAHIFLLGLVFASPLCFADNNSSPRLFLLSKGFVTEPLKSQFIQFIGEGRKDLKVAVIPNATNSQSKMQSKTGKVRTRFVDMGFDAKNIALFDIRTSVPKQLLNYDLIYILGGNPFLLLRNLRETNTDEVLRECIGSGKPVVGYSAGALVLGPDLAMMNSLDGLLGFNDIGLEELQCLGIYDFEIFPHYDEFTAEVQGLADAIHAYQTISRKEVYTINDSQGIVLENGRLRLIE